MSIEHYERLKARFDLFEKLSVAVDDLISIFDWITNDSPANAAAFIEKLDQQIGSLSTHPF